MTPTSAPDLPDIDKVLQMTEDMELISDFLTNARFVGDRVHVSIEHLAECIRNTRPQSEASAEALEVFDAMIKYGEHQMECSFEELLNNMKVKEAKQTIRAALATPVGWMPIETCKPFDGLVAYVAFKDGFYSLATYRDFENESNNKKERVQFWSLVNFHDNSSIYKYYGNLINPVMWYAIPNPISAPPHTEERG